MRKIFSVARSSLVTGAALLASLGLAVDSAFASDTWTVTGGGNLTGVSTDASLTDGSTSIAIPCASSGIIVSMANGTGLPGAGIGSFTSLTWSSCTGPLNLALTLSAQSLPWSLNAVSVTPSGVSGTVTGVQAHISGNGCTADLGGATPGTTATLDILYSSNDLRFTGTGDLHAWNVSGLCIGLINSGDALSYTADYLLSPGTAHITSP
ncbi:hypothetical protein [Streptomyces sp. NPDC020917]|uniref:hypothetical protein n=1 Tax=Streptomyces sp. NPDC020917 TaxID=3365102 RepID=UPI003799E3A9